MKRKDVIWIGIACLLLGVAIAFQAKFIQSTYSDGVSPSQKTAEIMKELSAAKAEKERLSEEVRTLEQQLTAIQDSASDESGMIKSMTEDLNKYKQFAGFTRVSGSGIVVTVDNPPVDLNAALEKNIAYDYKLLLDLVNELNSAGAEGLSINEQRMVNNTEVRLAGNQVNVNTIPLTPPFVVKAIGNPKTLDGAVNQRFGIVQNIREMGYYVEVKQVETLELPAFNGKIQFRYATPVN